MVQKIYAIALTLLSSAWHRCAPKPIPTSFIGIELLPIEQEESLCLPPASTTSCDTSESNASYFDDEGLTDQELSLCQPSPVIPKKPRYFSDVSRKTTRAIPTPRKTENHTQRAPDIWTVRPEDDCKEENKLSYEIFIINNQLWKVDTMLINEKLNKRRKKILLKKRDTLQAEIDAKLIRIQHILTEVGRIKK